MNQLFLNTAQLLLKGTDRNLDSGTVSSVVITGVVVVFIGLILLIFFVFLYGRIFEVINNKKFEKSKKILENKVSVASNQNTTNNNQSEPIPIIENGIDEEVVAVITAAIMAMSAKSGKRLALKSVKHAKPSRPVWANAGIAENTRPF